VAAEIDAERAGRFDADRRAARARRAAGTRPSAARRRGSSRSGRIPSANGLRHTLPLQTKRMLRAERNARRARVASARRTGGSAHTAARPPRQSAGPRGPPCDEDPRRRAPDRRARTCRSIRAR
jgi:hypothetical protein